MIRTILLLLLLSTTAVSQQLQVLEDTDSLKARREKTNANFNLLNDRISSNSVQAHSHSNKSVLDLIPLSAGLANRFLAMNAAGTALEFKQFVAGNGISLNFSGGTITVAATGGTGINSLNGLVGASQVFANDTNIVINSSGSTHTLGWSGQLAPGRGGTGNAFFNVIGPASTIKNFPFPNKNATILTDAAPVTPGQGGLGATNLNGIIRGNGASPATALAAPVGALVGTTDAQTLEGKTIDVEASGNNIKTVSTIWLDGAGCNGDSPSPNWDLPASNAPVAACEPLSNTHKGLLNFPDGGNDLTAQRMIALPSDWTGAIDVKFRWQSTATSGNVVLGISTSCTNDGEADNQTWSAYSDITDAAKGTGGQLNLANISGITASGCSAGELLHVRIARRLSQSADTMAGTLSLVGVEVILRRNQ